MKLVDGGGGHEDSSRRPLPVTEGIETAPNTCNPAKGLHPADPCPLRRALKSPIRQTGGSGPPSPLCPTSGPEKALRRPRGGYFGPGRPGAEGQRAPPDPRGSPPEAMRGDSRQSFPDPARLRARFAAMLRRTQAAASRPPPRSSQNRSGLMRLTHAAACCNNAASAIRMSQNAWRRWRHCSRR